MAKMIPIEPDKIAVDKIYIKLKTKLWLKEYIKILLTIIKDILTNIIYLRLPILQKLFHSL